MGQRGAVSAAHRRVEGSAEEEHSDAGAERARQHVLLSVAAQHRGRATARAQHRGTELAVRVQMNERLNQYKYFAATISRQLTSTLRTLYRGAPSGHPRRRKKRRLT